MRKAISSTMEIIIALVVILVAALVILSIFGLQIPGITGPVQGTADFAACTAACGQYCLQNPGSSATGPAVGASCKLDTYKCDCKTPGVQTTGAGQPR